MVIVVALYQLARAGFLAYVFAQCWEAQGTGIPPFGEVEMHNPAFDAPFFFVYAALAVFSVIVAIGLASLGNWARLGSTVVLASMLLYWFIEQIIGYRFLAFPVETSKILAVFFMEALAIGVLYLAPESKLAFAPPVKAIKPAAPRR